MTLIRRWFVVAALVAGCGGVVKDNPDAGGGSGVDECATNNGGCDANATCTDTPTASTCACNTGYEGDGQTCTDVDECAIGNGNCAPVATCTNADGGRTCECPPDHVGDGETCAAVWTKVATLPDVNLDPDGFGARTAALGSRIYFGPATNTLSRRFFRAYDTTNQTFSMPLAMPPGPENDFCACGYTAFLVGDTTQLNLFGNDGYRYHPLTNTWTAVTSYRANARGEAAAAFETNSDSVYMIGGRGTQLTATRYVVSSNSFVSEPGTFAFPADSAVAWAPAGGNVVYVAGGDAGGAKLMSHATGSGVWTALPDGPMAFGRAAAMGDFEGKLWIATGDRLHVFDVATATWGAPRALPPGFVDAVTTTTGTYALVQAGANLEVHVLNRVE